MQIAASLFFGTTVSLQHSYEYEYQVRTLVRTCGQERQDRTTGLADATLDTHTKTHSTDDKSDLEYRPKRTEASPERERLKSRARARNSSHNLNNP